VSRGKQKKTAKLLLSWMEDDPYGFCHNLDRQVVKVLDKKGLDVLASQIRAKFESVPSRDEQRFPEYARRKWGGALKTLLAGQRDVKAYIALCEQTEFNAQDCLAIAKIYQKRRRPEDALTWVERGLAIASSDNRRSFGDHELHQMQRSLLAGIGRNFSMLLFCEQFGKKSSGPFGFQLLSIQVRHERHQMQPFGA
jgi:hypothetical protein